MNCCLYINFGTAKCIIEEKCLFPSLSLLAFLSLLRSFSPFSG